MKLRVGLFVLLLTVTSFARSPIPIGGRCGGDGPRPLWLSSEFDGSPLEILPAEGSLKEATLLGGQEEIVYRNENDEIWKMNPDLPLVQTLVGTSTLPISPLSDLSGRFLLTRDSGWLMDLVTGSQWRKFLNVSPLTHGFWNGSTLYTLETQRATDGSLSYQAYRLGPTDTTAVAVCTFPKPPGLPVSLGKGHAFPNFIFYRARPTSSGPVLSFWKFNPIRCTSQEYQFVEPFVGNIKSVYRYEALNSTLVLVDHPKMSIYWHSGNSCRYFGADDEKVLPLRFDTPVVGTWSHNHGASLVFLNQEKRAAVLTDLHITGLDENDFLLTNSGDTLYAATQIDDWKWLVRLKLSQSLKTAGTPNPKQK